VPVNVAGALFKEVTSKLYRALKEAFELPSVIPFTIPLESVASPSMSAVPPGSKGVIVFTFVTPLPPLRSIA
jgi:hypothetical protein